MSSIVEDKREMRPNALRALDKARAQEKKKLKKGWKYVEVIHNLSILVPCDQQGQPTKAGLKRMARYKKPFS